MKTSTFLKAALVTACINPPPLDIACILHSVQGQIVPPFGLEWDRWDAPDFRSSGIVYEWNGTALVGDEEASITAVPSDNGHDWWNDLTMIRDEFGEPVGYAAVGYVGWSNWGAPQQGCFAQQGPNAGSLPVHLVKDDIQRGRIRSAIGMYDLDGELLWIRAYHVGAFHGIIQDSNGDLVVCGTLEGNDQLAYFDDMVGVPPLLYNPAVGEPTVLLDNADCGAVSGGARPQMTLMKLDIEGDVLWNHCFNAPTSVDEGVKTRGNGSLVSG